MLKRRGIIEWKCNTCTKPIAVSSRDPTLASDVGNDSHFNGANIACREKEPNTKLQKNTLWHEIEKWSDSFRS